MCFDDVLAAGQDQDQDLGLRLPPHSPLARFCAVFIFFPPLRVLMLCCVVKKNKKKNNVSAAPSDDVESEAAERGRPRPSAPSGGGEAAGVVCNVAFTGYTGTWDVFQHPPSFPTPFFM